MEHVGDAIAVEVDRPQIAAELDALRAEAPAPAGIPGAEAAPALPSVPPDQKAAELAPLVGGALFEISATFAPNWDVTKAETERLGNALAAVLAHWFPDTAAIEPKYVALFSFGMAAWAVAGARRDENGFRPLRKTATPPPNQPPPTNLRAVPVRDPFTPAR